MGNTFSLTETSLLNDYVDDNTFYNFAKDHSNMENKFNEDLKKLQHQCKLKHMERNPERSEFIILSSKHASNDTIEYNTIVLRCTLITIFNNHTPKIES